MAPKQPESDSVVGEAKKKRKHDIISTTEGGSVEEAG